MLYNYNRLWKLLIDKKITKTEMRKQAGISTNILAKMGKEEPVSIESLAKICIALKCGLDDIVEITTNKATEVTENGTK
ncbi:helix-turn-helix transcriptional regulator [Anaerotignum sp.]|uniref:helix-turn-helix domain-containing protein n=1 Tax=Anaerotignum sp. TaxID=2039241 RepID=UPI0033347418